MVAQAGDVKRGMIVSPIENGTVIDHLPPGRAVRIAQMLGLTEGAVVIIGQNLKSTKYGRKDLIKVEDRFLTDEECSRIALLAPNATVNIIRHYELVEKRKVSIPEVVERIAVCSNVNCITNKEPVPTRMITVSRSPVTIACYYCGYEVRAEDLRLRG